MATTQHTTKRNKTTGVVTYEEWCKDGEFNRVNGPARIWRDAATGATTREEWLRNGALHRFNGPAIVEKGVRYADGTTGDRESWWTLGNLNRTDGPAVTVRDSATGAVMYEAWHRNGVEIKPPIRQDVVGESLKAGGPSVA